MEKVNLLVLAENNIMENYKLPDFVEVTYEGEWFERKRFIYDIAIIDRALDDFDAKYLKKMLRAYTFFVTERVDITGNVTDLLMCKMGSILKTSNIQTFLDNDIEYYFAGSYGEKVRPDYFLVSKDFAGKVQWNGGVDINLEGDFGDEFNQITYVKYNYPIFNGRTVALWMEYEKDASVEIRINVKQFAPGSLDAVIKTWDFSEKDMVDEVQIKNPSMDGPLFISVLAKGEGKLKIRGLHLRWSRMNHGAFMPGGIRAVTSDRQEVFAYFDPGDMKPPLNVYFSGYKTQEGFEAYYMMRGMGSPFLLIAETRIEGGGFYMGSEEYEGLIKDLINELMEKLNFTSDDVVMAGLSMGTYGALYYGCDFTPHALLLGKPLASIGNVARNEKMNRPGGFPTSLDVLKNVEKSINAEAVKALNNRFWDKFDAADFSKTKFIMSYMIEDDYDMDAYEMIISHLKSTGVKAYGKGIHGRHNDNTSSIVSWFSSQYKKMMAEDFER